MFMSGIGLYMGYIPFNSLLYDLLIAAFHYKANVGFLTYFCDSCGYLGSVTVMMIQTFVTKSSGGDSNKEFYVLISLVVGGGGIVLMTLASIYWLWKHKRWTAIGADDGPLLGDAAVPLVTSEGIIPYASG
jgi:hypothetical protein